jgi:hypothetical protein
MTTTNIPDEMWQELSEFVNYDVYDSYNLDKEDEDEEI